MPVYYPPPNLNPTRILQNLVDIQNEELAYRRAENAELRAALETGGAAMNNTPEEIDWNRDDYRKRDAIDDIRDYETRIEAENAELLAALEACERELTCEQALGGKVPDALLEQARAAIEKARSRRSCPPDNAAERT